MKIIAKDGTKFETYRLGAEFVMTITNPGQPIPMFRVALDVKESISLRNAIAASMKNMKAVAIEYVGGELPAREKPVEAASGQTGEATPNT